MELHGGRIGLYSEGEGMGSTFYIELPIYNIGAGERTKGREREREGERGEEGRGGQGRGGREGVREGGRGGD